MSSSPSSKKGNTGNQSLRPVTIKQLINATQTHADADFKIDGGDISQVTFVAVIRDIVEQSTNFTYMMEDGSSAIEVRKWIQSDDSDYQAQKRSGWKEGVYVRVIGHLNDFNKKRQVVAYHIRLIKDHNEITYHCLEALYAHLLFTKGLLPSLAGPNASLVSNSQGLNHSAYNPQGAPAGAYAGGGASKCPISGEESSAILQLVEQNRTEEGVDIEEIIGLLKHQITSEQIRKGIDWLIAEGHIYSTIDDMHFRLTHGDHSTHSTHSTHIQYE